MVRQSGDPEGYESTAFVQLNPGDGENIVGCCAWGGQIFVFKETRLFVFGGISPDAQGKPIFNFRSVDLGTRILPPAVAGGEQVSAGGEGVYFIANDDGLWVTTRGEPSLLSAGTRTAGRQPSVDRARCDDLRDGALDGCQGHLLRQQRGLHRPRRHPAASDLLLKFDLRALRWTVWKADLNSFVAWNEETTTHRTRLFFSAADEALKHVYFYTPAVDTDPTVEMDPRWQSGFYDLGNVDEKTLTNTKVWGTGEVDVKVAKNFGVLGAAATFKLGEGGAIDQQQQQRGQTATLFSHQFSGTAPWSVQRISRYMRETTTPATQRP